MKYLIITILLVSNFSFAQNYITNGNFESYTSLPTTQGNLTCSNWQQVVLSADYLNTASYTGWSPQTGGAYEGNGWAGFASYGNSGGSSEAIGQDITANPFLTGNGYSIEFYAKRSPSGSYSSICGGVDVYGFNTTPALGVIGQHPINMGGELLFSSSTVNSDLWVKKEGCFVPTQEINYVVLCVTYAPNCGQYIYVDSLSITAGSSSGSVLNLNANFCAGDTVILDASTAGGPYLWQDGSTNATFEATQEGLYWVQAQGTCGTITDSIYLSGSLPQSGLSSDTLICGSGSLLLNAGSNPNTTYLWNNGSTDSTYLVTQSGTYWVEMSNSCGIITDTVNVDYFQSQTLDLGPDQSFCDGDSYTITLSNVSTNYLWSTGSTDSTITFTQSGTYWVDATNACGTQSDTIVITVQPGLSIDAGPDVVFCSGVSSVTIGADPVSTDEGASYTWNNGAGSGIIDLTGPNLDNGQASVSPATTTEYIVTLQYNGCFAEDTVRVYIDAPPTASNPADIIVECAADVPAPDPSVVTDESDDFTVIPIVTWVSDSSDGNSCPEKIFRTYQIADSCPNIITVVQSIIIFDVTAPVLDAPPANVTVQCPADIPSMTDLPWTDNCDGTGTVTGVDVSDGNSCPEMITRTWTYTDACGNSTSQSQSIVIDDTTPPTASDLPAEHVSVLPAANTSLVADAADNCTTNPVVTWVSDISDGGMCPESVIRTYSVTDDCNNEIFVTQLFTIGDNFPNAQFSASPLSVTNLDTEIDFFNSSSGAVTYEWDFSDGSDITNEENPTHLFPETQGDYTVMLVAYSEFGCPDTAYLTVQVEEELIFFIPNAFTPNGDEFNNSLTPVFVSGFDPFDFTMLVYNRWGEVIWESHDTNVGWDGTYHGQMVQSGVYQWKIEFKNSNNDERKTYYGHVNILR